LNIFDLYRHLYDRELQFVPRHNRRYAIFSPPADRTHLFFDAVFGIFPEDEQLAYIHRGYRDAFDPQSFDSTPSAALQVIRERYAGPLRLTDYGIERQGGRDDPTIYIFDSSTVHDTIDFWNLKQFRRDIFPVDVAWIEQYA